MPSFEYTARRATGEVVAGTAQAADAAALKNSLADRGLLLIRARAATPSLLRMIRPARVGTADLLTFIREFRHLVEAGLTVSQSLGILQDGTANRALTAAIEGMRAEVERGAPLDKAAATQDGVFNETVQAALRAGQRTSQLDVALRRLESYLAMRRELARKTRKALAYPAFLMVLLAVVLAILMLFVLPRFSELYAEFDSDLPAATQVLMSLVRGAPVWVPAAAAALALGVFAWRRLWSRPSSRAVIDAALLRIPVLGRLLRDVQLVQVSYMLAMLLKAGTPLREALDFVTASVGNSAVRRQVAQVAAGIEVGRSFSGEVERAGLYPPISTSMLRAGELSGALADLVEAVGVMHEQEVDDRMARLLALIEPAMMLIVGLVLGTVIITVYLPIFGLSSVVR